MGPTKVFFLGSSSFAVPSLEVLVELGANPTVVTKPDRPAGRGKRLHATPLKEKAAALGLAVWQPETLKDEAVLARFREEKPDLVLTVAYGEYIPRELLTLPRLGCVNLHPSLLPRYRGAAPVQRALMAGETETGVTLAYVVEKWDSGDILLQEKAEIFPQDNAGTLLDRLAHQGASLLRRALPRLAQGTLPAIPQNSNEATVARRIKPEEVWLDWGQPARVLVNKIRGLAPDPAAHGRFRDFQVKILKGAVTQGEGAPGTVVRAEKEGAVVAAGEGSVLLLEVQPESRKVLSGRDFVNGFHVEAGQSFQR